MRKAVSGSRGRWGNVPKLRHKGAQQWGSPQPPPTPGCRREGAGNEGVSVGSQSSMKKTREKPRRENALLRPTR